MEPINKRFDYLDDTNCPNCNGQVGVIIDWTKGDETPICTGCGNLPIDSWLDEVNEANKNGVDKIINEVENDALLNERQTSSS